MSEKKLSKEQIEAPQKCKTKKEVEKFAQDDQLTDEELEKVVGGGDLSSLALNSSAVGIGASAVGTDSSAVGSGSFALPGK